MTVARLIALVLAIDAAGAEPHERQDQLPKTESQPARQKETIRLKIRLKVGDRVISATLQDSAAAHDFAKLLPLTLTMHDLFGREKAGQLPRSISEDGQRTRNFQVGQIAYWAPATDVAIFYHPDGPAIPEPGIIVLGVIDSGVGAIAFQGTKAVTFEAAE